MRYSSSLKASLKGFDRLIVLKRCITETIQSHYRYVLNTPFHPDYRFLKSLPKDQALSWIEYKYASSWKEWTVLWERVATERNYILIDYSELRNDTYSVMEDIIIRLDNSVDEERLKRCIDYCSMSGMKSRFIQKNFFR